MQRRSFLKAGIAGGALGFLRTHRTAFGQTSTGLTRYVDALPIPSVIHPTSGITHVSMSEAYQKLHRDLPPTKVWGYNGTYPGPTIEARKGVPVSMLWSNTLPPTHLLHGAVDHKVHGAGMGAPEVRTVVHVHGIKVLPESDGYPEAWFTPGFQQVGPSFSGRVCNYPNDQRATCLWYHDHALGITRLNVYAGLCGYYLIRDGIEDSLNLPSGKYEIPLLIQDRTFHPDGSLLYPTDTTGTQEVWVPEFFGDTVLVNGKVWPHLEVEPRKYRFRMLNGSNARFFHVKLMESTADGVLTGLIGPSFHQIGTDGGLLPAPVTLADLLMAPAERFDVVIDFNGCQGRSFVLTNDAAAPYPGGGEGVPGEIMQFRVNKPLSGPDSSSLPDTLLPIQIMDRATAVRERNLELSELDRASDSYPIIGLLDGMNWSDPVTENPRAGTTEIWNFVNTSDDAHPIHTHLVTFQVLERQRFAQNVWAKTRNLVYLGQPEAPAVNERPAGKDTIIAYPGMVTKVIARFDLPTGAVPAPGQRFRYAWHCHILEHEDNEMMRPYDVIA
ncbi:MAG: bilirubin oxidase [Proteobacteria bacterium]|nr:MAG: bilirubin oxidase [Pseudomonadota bacterium]